MDLVFIKFDSDLKNQKIEDLKRSGLHVIPIMPKAALAMLNSGFCDVKLPIDFLDLDYRTKIFNEAIILSKNWYSSFKDNLTFHSIDLMDCCRLQMITFFQDLLASEKICLKLIDIYKPKKAIFFSKPVTHSFDENMFNGQSDIFEAVAQWRFLQAGIEIQILERDTHKNINVKPDIKEEIAQEQFSVERLEYINAPRKTPLVVGFGIGFDLFIIWPYIKNLASKIDAVPLLLNLSPKLLINTMRSGLSYDEEMRFIFIHDIPFDSLIPKKLCDVKTDCISSLNIGNSLPEILRNPFLAFQFEKLFDAFLIGTIRSICRAEKFFKDLEVVLFIDDHNAGHANRAWTQTAKNMGVKTATIPHGLGVNLVEFFDFNAHFAFAWGELGRKNLELASPEKKDRILIVGNSFMEGFQKKDSTISASRKTILLATGGFLHQVWTDFDLSKFIDSWDKIFDHIKERPEIKFIIKPHPSFRDFGYWYKSRVNTSQLKNLEIVDDRKIEDILDEIFLTVLVGKPGTAAFVSMRCSVPVVYLDCLLARNAPGYAVWKEILPVIKSVQELFNFIDMIQDERETYSDFAHNNISLAKYMCLPFNFENVISALELKKKHNNE
ncbi:MAG: hypothetical protein HQK79_04260 [Desulfobacterales bacterium]|nr:hypothetical protein [Desulfobacterales bacterium]